MFYCLCILTTQHNRATQAVKDLQSQMSCMRQILITVKKLEWEEVFAKKEKQMF